MKNHKTPAGLLQEIANIEHMEAGKLCVIGQGKEGPFFNLQCRENGKPVSRYVSRDQVEVVQQNTENYRTFQSLVDKYAQVVTTQTREERLDGKKKAGRHSSSLKTKNSRG